MNKFKLVNCSHTESPYDGSPVYEGVVDLDGLTVSFSVGYFSGAILPNSPDVDDLEIYHKLFDGSADVSNLSLEMINDMTDKFDSVVHSLISNQRSGNITVKQSRFS